jgi:two-component system, chemotaxis family, protein-glutamate methylesterase/glutaminase
MTVRVMVVDDSALYRQMVKNVLRTLTDVEVIGLACTGKEALEKIPELKPELLTLDVQMPDMNGLELLREIKQRRLPVKSIMLSSLTAHGAQVTTDALLAGAFDFIQKPNSPDANTNRLQLESLLAEKINAFQQSRNITMPTRKPTSSVIRINESRSSETRSVETRTNSQVNASRSAESSDSPASGNRTNRIDAVAIGTSTGGPIALRDVIPRLPKTLPVPVFVVQHMPPNYTRSLASRIGEVSQLEVHEAANGMKVEAGHAYIAQGGLHMGVELQNRKPVIRTSDEPPEHNCRPAVDFTLRSLCNVYGGNVLAVILTGMGRDGTEGCRLVKQWGGSVIAQHPEGCTVYGMPKVVVEEQLADRVVPLEKIATWIVRLVESSRSPQ